GEATLFTDPRYTFQAGAECDCKVAITKNHLLPAVVATVKRKKLKRVGVERERLTFLTYDFLREKLPLGTEMAAVTGAVETLRMVKSADELRRIRRSVETNSKAFGAAMGRMKVGMRENDLAAELDFQMRRHGAEGCAFETIVASGARSALPHARPTLNRIEANQLLLVDMGSSQDGYASDMTRTVFVGSAKPEWKRRYRAVLEAQLAAIAAIRAGVAASKPDREARRVLAGHGLDKEFTHSTGHGLGLEIHEAPRIGKKEKTLLQAGMAITVEPGIYLKDQGGIRIEDTVVVTETGCEILTPTTKDLTVF
ncbi:MAG: aminopeptidase P family protein, partial [Bryobacterales bacterium]|nr:aminopeptidase P family protein [Bryobacterales bacterium]